VQMQTRATADKHHHHQSMDSNPYEKWIEMRVAWRRVELMRVRKAFVKMKTGWALHGYQERQTWFGAFTDSMRSMTQLHTDTLSILDAVDRAQTWRDYQNGNSTRDVLELLKVLHEATKNGAIKFVFVLRGQIVEHTHSFVYNLPLPIQGFFYTGWINKSFWSTCALEVPHYGMAFNTAVSLKSSVPWLFDILGELPDYERMKREGSHLVSVTGYTCPNDNERWVQTITRNGNVQFYPRWWLEETGGLVSQQSEEECGDYVGELPSMDAESARIKKSRRRAGKKKQAKKELAETRVQRNSVGSSSSSQLEPIDEQTYDEPDDEGEEEPEPVQEPVQEPDSVVQLSSLLEANLTTQENYDDVATSVATALACAVCFTNEKSVAMIPCGHRCVCTTCAELFSGGGKCPMCRTTLTGVMRVFD